MSNNIVVDKVRQFNTKHHKKEVAAEVEEKYVLTFDSCLDANLACRSGVLSLFHQAFVDFL